MVEMGKTIVFADDEEDIVKFVKARLSKRGYTVLIAVNGQEALELIRQHQPDLVLLDKHMPLLDGTEVCKRMKDDEQLRAIPVILLTASSGSAAPEALQATQADDCIIKPFEAAELFEKIERLLG